MADQGSLPGVGHNKPPTPAEELIERLQIKTDESAKRIGELTSTFAAAPMLILDEVTAEKVTLLASQVAAELKALDNDRKAEKKTFDDLGKAVGEHYNGVAAPLVPIKEELAKRLHGWNLMLQAQKQREAQRLRDEAAALAAKAQTREEVKTATKAATAARRAGGAKIGVKTDYGQGAHMRTVKKWRIIDESLVPRGYLMIDDSAINEARQNDTPVPGIEFYEESSTVVRS